MKKLLVICILSCMMLMTVACGGGADTGSSTNNQQTNSNVSQNDEIEKDSETDNHVTELSMEVLENAPETPAEELDYLVYDGVAYVSGYLGISEIIVIPEELEGCPVVDISDGAFRNNENIKAVKIGDNVKTIGDSSFVNCSSLEYVLFGKSVESVGDGTFVGCANMKEFRLNEGLISVGELAICGAEVPTIIPKSVTEIGLNGFKQPVKVYAGSYAEEYIVDYAANFGAEFVYEIIE